MTHKRYVKFSILITVLLLAACAPADLDITPTLTPTPAPTPTATPDPSEIQEAEAVNLNAALADVIAETTPGTIPAGAVQWRRDASREVEALGNVTNGESRRVFITEQGGGQANLTFGVFDTPEDAQAHYEFITDLRASLETGDPDDSFPEPNLFGSGLYGSNAVIRMDNIFIEVSVEAFSSTAGNPLPSLARAAVGIVEDGLTEFEANPPEEVVSSDSEESDETEAEAETNPNAELAELIVASTPGTIAAGPVQWRRDTSRDVEVVNNVTNGAARRIFLTEQGGGQAELTYGVFDSDDDAQVYYDFLQNLRTSLENASPNDNFPEPNLFNTETYGSNALLRLDNIVIEANVLAFSSTLGDPLPPLARAAMNIVEDTLAEEG